MTCEVFFLEDVIIAYLQQNFRCTSGRIGGFGVSLQLVTFNGIFDIIDQEDFKAEKAGAILRVNDVDSPPRMKKGKKHGAHYLVLRRLLCLQRKMRVEILKDVELKNETEQLMVSGICCCLEGWTVGHLKKILKIISWKAK